VHSVVYFVEFTVLEAFFMKNPQDIVILCDKCGCNCYICRAAKM